MSIFNTPEWDRKFNNIFYDLQKSSCVVLIGPEIVKSEGRPLREVMREHLLKTNPNDIEHYYERDGFFLFSKENFSKSDVQREVVRFYKSLEIGREVPEDMLLQLARLPAPVFLSINPDAFLSEVANKYNIKHHFAFFKHGGAGVEEVEAPTSGMPLFYNLCGSLKEDGSLVLDYDDLFGLLSSLLGSPGLPQNLKFSLSNAKHFIFVGFDFDKWYSQLLLRLLSGGKKDIRKFAVDASHKNENTSMFLVKEFDIEFIKDEQSFLQELILRADRAGLLRETSKALQGEEALQILHLVQNGDLLAALNRLKNNPKSADDASGLLSQYHILEKGNAEKTIRSEDYLIGTNRIIQTIQDRLKTDF